MRDRPRRAGIEGDGFALGEALFDRTMSSPSGLVFTDDEYRDAIQQLGGKP